MNKIRVFVGSPSDVPQEREIVSIVVDELSRTLAPIVAVHLEAVMWETHAWPDVGVDAQDVINREIGEYDVFVGIMWRRFGTPTKRAKSGTGEEFQRAYKYFKQYQRPKIMFYFRRTPFFSTDIDELKQFNKVVQFRKQLQDFGVLFWEYEETLDFERRLREHLTKQILQLQKRHRKPEESTKPKIFLSYKRQDRDRVEPIYEVFRAAGFLPWMDIRDILPGKQWVAEIESAITAADFFLTFISFNTIDPNVKSETDFSVNSEVSIARRKFDADPNAPDLQPNSRSHFIPVRLDPITPPPAISKFQWVDQFGHNDARNLVDVVRKIWAQTRTTG